MKNTGALGCDFYGKGRRLGIVVVVARGMLKGIVGRWVETAEDAVHTLTEEVGTDA